MVLQSMHRKCAAFLIVLAGFTVSVHAQQGIQPEFRLRLAQSYERTGDYESAIRILTDLLRESPGNPALASELRHDLLQLKKYPEAIDIILQQLKKKPSDINLLSELGTIYYLNSQESTAVATWEQVIALNPKEMISYHIVGAAMTDSHLYERAIGIYLRGRTAVGDPRLFISELSNCYTITAHYTEATREYLTLLRQNPSQLSYVQFSIGTYTNSPDGLAAATSVIQEAASASNSDINLMRLLAWIYTEGHGYDKALDVFRIIDNRTSARGHELFAFADRSLHDRAYSVAAGTYREIIDRYPGFDRLPEAKYGYARATEGSLGDPDSLRLFGLTFPGPGDGKENADRTETIRKAIAGYQQVVDSYPKTEMGAASLLRIGILRQDFLQDPEGARTAFGMLLRLGVPSAGAVQEAGLRLGDIYLITGDLDKAAEQYTAIAGRGLRTSSIQEEAAFRLAELQYFGNHPDSALVLLGELTRNPASDIANDALSLEVFIGQHLQKDRPALAAFARGDLLRRRHKYADALEVYRSIPSSYPNSEMLDEAAARSGDVLAMLKKYPDAVQQYEQLMTGFPESILLDETLMKIGLVWQFGLRDVSRAIAAYEQLLARFPSSIYSADARKRIRSLRGDTL